MAQNAGGGNGGQDAELLRVDAAVAAGESVEQVRRVIEEVAGGDGERRVAAVNAAGRHKRIQRFLFGGERAEICMETALAAAIRLERNDLAGVLVEAGADPSKADEYWRVTPLAACVQLRQRESARALIAAGVRDVNEAVDVHSIIPRPCRIRDYTRAAPEPSYRCTAAHLCVAAPPPPGRTPILGVVRWPPPFVGCLEDLLRAGADVNARDSDGETLLHWVARATSDHERLVDLLLAFGADVNLRSSVLARADGLANGPEPQAERAPDWTPLQALLAARQILEGVKIACARKLIAAGAATQGVFDVNGDGLLHTAAAASRDGELVRFLIDEVKVPVDERSPLDGTTALFRACSNTEVMRVLLDAGADPNAKAKDDGRTPLWSCAEYSLEIPQMRLLLERGASVDVRIVTSSDLEGLTPLVLICLPWWRCELIGEDDAADAQAGEGAGARQLPPAAYYDPSRFKRGYWELLEEVFRRSSPETRQVSHSVHGSAVDALVQDEEGREILGVTHGQQPQPAWLESQLPPNSLQSRTRVRQLIGELLASGAPVSGRNAFYVLPIAISHGFAASERREAELARRDRSAAMQWRAHEDLVGLAFDFQELRAAEERVRATERRVEELERQLGSGSGSEGEEEGGGEAAGGGVD